MLYINIYIDEYLKISEILDQISKIDYYSGIKNKPDFKLKNGELLTIYLKSHSLDGLSGFDFDLALWIN